METTVNEVSTVSRPKAIAAWWHTVLFIAVLLFFSMGSAHSLQAATVARGRTLQYVVTIAWEWLMVLYIWWGIRRSGITLREVIGGRWETFEDFLLDIAIGIGFWIASLVALASIAQALHLVDTTSLDEAKRQLGFLAPQSGLEVVLWFALSATAGFCEEIIFRGYFQRQFSAACRSQIAGVVLAGILFGSAHGYEGLKKMILVGVLGMLFGALAIARKSLRPSMIAHTMQDSVQGMIMRMLQNMH